ncbi:G5 domain-containing protein [Litchfieldia salsa]|uniref:G5 domain-containing protein n=1 Tax=Litchfieldia salsa TaxID=930152 RepID=UPI0015873606|nr:G5 domain-containing protein [Litchfieldia salsa]
MRNQLKVKAALILISCVIFIFTFAQIGVTSYNTFASGDKFEAGTLIGSVDVEGLTVEEAEAKVTTEVNNWLASGQIGIEFGNESMLINKSDSFIFAIAETVKVAKQGVQTPLMVTIKPDVLNQSIETISNKKIDLFNAEQIQLSLQEKSSLLASDQLTLNLLSYLLIGEQKVVSSAQIPLETISSELTKWGKDVKEITLAPHQSFSLLTFVSENAFEASDETLSVIGTSIYKSILPTNIEIVERHISENLPGYATLGYEARVEKEHKDLMLYNANPFEYKLTFTLTNSDLKVEMIGPDLPYKYRVELGEEAVIKPRLIKQYDSKLSFGSKKVKTAGENGSMLKVTRVITKGKETEKVVVSEDYYRPIHKVVAFSLAGSSSLPTTNDSNSDSDESTSDDEGFWDNTIDFK